MKRVLFLILAFFCPPLAIAILDGFSVHFWLNLLVWVCCLHVGGIIHAWYLILTGTYEVKLQ